MLEDFFAAATRVPWHADCCGDTGGDPKSEQAMVLIVYYVVFMIAGDFAAYFLGLIVEKTLGAVASLWVFLTLYFLFLWFAWLLAVWMTAPKQAPATRV